MLPRRGSQPAHGASTYPCTHCAPADELTTIGRHRARRAQPIAEMRRQAGGGVAAIPTAPEARFAKMRIRTIPIAPESYFYCVRFSGAGGRVVESPARRRRRGRFGADPARHADKNPERGRYGITPAARPDAARAEITGLDESPCPIG